MDLQQFEARKRDHIQHALDSAHQARGASGLESIHLFHDSLPELDFSELSLESTRFKQPCSKPFYISGMTAGHSDAVWINEALADVCEEKGWALGVGSQRRDLEAPHSVLDRWRELRKKHPKLVIFSNLGLSQIIQTEVSEIRRVTDSLEAQALAVHANALQECLQPEGTPHFKGGLKALERVVAQLGIPIILKETGCGFSLSALKKLQGLGLSALDVAGLGGTHWGRIEGSRSDATSREAQAAHVFANWGESTVDSVLSAVEKLPQVEIWASGGVRTGLDSAKLMALGASQVGYAQPVIQVAMNVERNQVRPALKEWMERQEFELKIALMCTGSVSPKMLRNRKEVWKRI